MDQVSCLSFHYYFYHFLLQLAFLSIGYDDEECKKEKPESNAENEGTNVEAGETKFPPLGEGMSLFRKASDHQAQGMVMTYEQEAEQKEKLIDELEGKMAQDIESLIVSQESSTQKTITEFEFFQDNSKLLKQ